jgi:hypothetical protein
MLWKPHMPFALPPWKLSTNALLLFVGALVLVLLVRIRHQ